MKVLDENKLQMMADYINGYIKKHNGDSPKFGDILAYMDMSKSVGYRYLTRLNERGIVEYSGKGTLSIIGQEQMKSYFRRIPILGMVICGTPEEQEQYTDGYLAIPEEWIDGDCFLLRAYGDSMVDIGIEKCASAKKHTDCHKKPIKKDWIEDLVISEVRQKLNDEAFINDLTRNFMEFQTQENTVIPHLKQRLNEVNRSIDNLVSAIEQGIITPSTKIRLEELEYKRKEIEPEIAKESICRPLLTEEEVRFWFERLKELDIKELEHRKRLNDTFVNSVFVYDDRLPINCNYPNTSKVVRFSDIETTLDSSDILACVGP